MVTVYYHKRYPAECKDLVPVYGGGWVVACAHPMNSSRTYRKIKKGIDIFCELAYNTVQK